ncbi:MAG: helix-turn-helix transcriptional regulator [Clostridia bacterium]
MYETKLRKYRKERGLTMSELADLTGVSVGYICHLENGTRSNPSIETMEKISQVLNKSILEVFFK